MALQPSAAPTPKILWLHADKAGCGSYRCWTPALTLEEIGFENHFLQHQSIPPRRVGDLSDTGLQDLAEMDLVVFQRAVGTIFSEWIRACRRKRIPTIYELDDNLWDVAKHNPAAHFWHRKDVQKILNDQLAMVDHIICSTPPLREQVMAATGRPGTEVLVCYNHLHPSVWGQEAIPPNSPRHDNGSSIVLGWQGSNTHDTDFAEAAVALSRIIQDFPQTIVRFFGNVPSSVRGRIPESRFQWSKGVPFDKYPPTLAFMNFDIGLAPITDSKFNRAKSNLKWLEYSALGVPTVASRVYPYASSIEEGRTGFLASTPDEWYAALAQLVQDADVRKRVGQQAKTTVWSEWVNTVRIAPWRKAFNDQLARYSRRTAHGIPLVPEFMGRTGTASG